MMSFKMTDYESICQEDITILNVSAANSQAAKHVRHKQNQKAKWTSLLLTERQGRKSAKT